MLCSELWLRSWSWSNPATPSCAIKEERWMKRTIEGWISGRCGRGGREGLRQSHLSPFHYLRSSPPTPTYTYTSPPHTPNEGYFSSRSLISLLSGISRDQTHPWQVAMETPLTHTHIHTHYQQTRSVSRSHNASILPVPSISISACSELVRSGAGSESPELRLSQSQNFSLKF